MLLANTTEYGLAAYFYTKDLARAWKVAEELEFGMVRFLTASVACMRAAVIKCARVAVANAAWCFSVRNVALCKPRS